MNKKLPVILTAVFAVVTVIFTVLSIVNFTKKDSDGSVIDEKTAGLVLSQGVEVDSASSKLDGVESINDAELLKGAVVCAKEEDMPPLPDGVYYLRDIMGLNVYEGERYIGQIYDWIETGPTNVYVIKREVGKDVLIPAIDDVVLNIDIENKTMSVKLMEGLVQDDN